MATTSRRPLVLHFDINKTIIMCDPVKGVGCDEQLNVLLSEACWGNWKKPATIPTDAAEKVALAATWRMEKGPTTEAQEGLVTYGELLEEVLKMEKKEVQALKNTFTEPGSPGDSVRATYQELQSLLQLPEGVTVPGVPDAVGKGRRFIIPAFFNLVIKLQKEGRDFRIVFRTFGIDSPNVINEFNLFCRGEHPCFRDVPADMKSRAVATPHDTGEWYRDDAGPHLSLCMPREFGTQLVTQAHGVTECAALLRRKLFDGEVPSLSLALRDFFLYWRKQGEACNSGKALLIEPRTPGAAHHIFFDDNIERTRAHIVDGRDVSTGESLPFCDTQGIHLIKAEPLEAIRDPTYFITAVEVAEAMMASQDSASAQG